MLTIPQNIPGIYRIDCLATGKFYVGSSRDIRKRAQCHLRDLRKGRHHSPPLQYAWAKYGADAFVFGVLETCDVSQLIEREQFYLDTLRPYDRSIGFNIGRYAGAAARGTRASDETKKKMSERNKGRKMPPFSDEHRAKMSIAARNRRASDTTRAKISAALRGKTPSEATRAKLRAANKGRKPAPWTDEKRKKLSETLKGHKMSDASRQKSSATKRARPWPALHIVTTPEGKELLVHLKAFARKHMFKYDGLLRACRRGKKYKGHTIRRASRSYHQLPLDL